MALLTAGAVEVQHFASNSTPVRSAGIEQDATAMVGPADKAMHGAAIGAPAAPAPEPASEAPAEPAPPAEAPAAEGPAAPAPEPVPEPTTAPEPPADPPTDAAVGDPNSGGGTIPTNPGDSDGVIVPGDPPPVVDPPAEPLPPGAAISGPEAYGPGS